MRLQSEDGQELEPTGFFSTPLSHPSFSKVGLSVAKLTDTCEVHLCCPRPVSNNPFLMGWKRLYFLKFPQLLPGKCGPNGPGLSLPVTWVPHWRQDLLWTAHQASFPPKCAMDSHTVESAEIIFLPIFINT